jgi:hypothetical protein
MATGKKTGGRKAGTPNRATVERELLAAKAVAAAKAMENPEIQAAVAGVEAAKAAGRKLGKDILDEFANVLAGAAAYYQPTPGGTNPNADPVMFFKYAELAMYAAKEVSQFQSPKLSAVMVGMAQVRTIQVDGGLPSLVRPSPPIIEAKPDPQAPGQPEKPAAGGPAPVPLPFSEAAE